MWAWGWGSPVQDRMEEEVEVMGEAQGTSMTGQVHSVLISNQFILKWLNNKICGHNIISMNKSQKRRDLELKLDF